jgi:hypothetical protein
MDRNGAASKDELDPDLAELLSIETPAEVPVRPPGKGEPDFNTLFKDDRPPIPAKPGEPVDTTKKRFAPIAKSSQDPKPYFADKNWYKVVLSGEGDPGPRVHDLLGKFMKATDIEEKSKLRAQLISAYWDLGASVAARAGHGLLIPKRFLLRYGIVSPTFLTPEHQDMVSRIMEKNTTGEPVHYLDEWLEKIASGEIRPSTVDEVKSSQKDAGRKISDEVEKKKGQRDTELTVLRGKIGQLDEREVELRSQVDVLLRHEIRDDLGGLKGPFSGAQKAAASSIMDILRQLSSLDGQIASSYVELAGYEKDLESLTRKAAEGSASDTVVDARTVGQEFQSIRQMAKMSVGRKGNHFPIFTAQFVRPQLNEIGTRENVINTMAQIETLDPGLFLRTYKQTTTRIVPYTILLPCYGDTGLCWEPFEKFNRATSRGRIAIPMFPKNLHLAVLTALADLRWQVAKEKASYYWMEEGLTGKYYQWFSERKLKGDVREYFIRDYMIWISKESQGMQKLDKEIRGLFWRMMPFPQAVKDNLKNRGFIYNELYKKDQNIAKSDGY